MNPQHLPLYLQVTLPIVSIQYHSVSNVLLVNKRIYKNDLVRWWDPHKYYRYDYDSPRILLTKYPNKNYLLQVCCHFDCIRTFTIAALHPTICAGDIVERLRIEGFALMYQPLHVIQHMMERGFEFKERNYEYHEIECDINANVDTVRYIIEHYNYKPCKIFNRNVDVMKYLINECGMPIKPSRIQSGLVRFNVSVEYIQYILTLVDKSNIINYCYSQPLDVIKYLFDNEDVSEYGEFFYNVVCNTIHTDVIQYFITRCAALAYYKTSDGVSCLNGMLEWNYNIKVDGVKCLAECNRESVNDVDIYSISKYSIITYINSAMGNKYDEMVIRAISAVNKCYDGFNIKNSIYNDRVLECATSVNDFVLVKHLIDNGVTVKSSTLARACEDRAGLKIVKYLVEHYDGNIYGLKVDSDHTLLMKACDAEYERDQRLKVIQYLVEHNHHGCGNSVARGSACTACVNYEWYSGKTALIFACTGYVTNLDVIKYLAKYTDLNIRDDEGRKIKIRYKSQYYNITGSWPSLKLN